MKIYNKIWLGATPIFLLLAGLFPLPAAGQMADHLVISQIQITGGAGKANYDFVEIHNPTSAPVDLQGYRLVKRTKEGATDNLIKSFTESFIIPPLGYFLWANSDYLEISLAADIVTSASIAADNAVALRNGPNDTGTVIDAVGWGAAANSLIEGAVFAESPGEGQVILRKNNSTDTDNNSDDFILAAPNPRNSGTVQTPVQNPQPEQQPEGDITENDPQAEPTLPDSPASPADSTPDYAKFANSIIISEIVPNPEGPDQGNEWVEFYNPGLLTIDFSGWLIDDSGDVLAKNAHKISAGSEISASGYIVITLSKGTPALNNSGGDCLQLYSPDKVFRKKVCYEESFSEGQSYALRPNGVYAITEEITKSGPNSFAASESTSSTSGINANIVINEVYPNPEEEQDEEFIELRNIGIDEVDLTGWEIADRSRKYIITRDDFSETEIGPNGFFVLPRTITRIALNNTGGEKVTLFNPQGQEHDAAEYEESALKGLSYSRNKDGDYEWSLAVTVGRENIVDRESTTENLEEDAEEDVEISEEVETYPLAELRNLPEGTRVATEGLVSAVPGTFGERVMYLAGSGIRVVFISGVTVPKFTIGARVLLTGTLTSSRGELQLAVSATDNIDFENFGEVPEPHAIKTGEVGEDTEGFLVKIAGIITRSAGSTFYIDDGSGEARILVLDSTGIKKPETKKGSSAVITGIVTQFGEVYRVTPRMQSDIEAGGVLGAGLPITGTGVAEVILVIALVLILGKKLLNLEKFRKYLL